MNDQTKKYLGWLLVVVAILIAGYLGVSYPIPAPPLVVTPPPVVVEPQAVTNYAVRGFFLDATTSYTPTTGTMYTPTTGIVNFTPAGDLNITLGTCTNGARTVLYNSLNQTVTISDTGNAVLATDVGLGQYDALGLACISTKWVQVSAASAN